TGTPLTGTAEFTGKIGMVNAKIEATLGVTGSSVGFPGGTIEKLNSTLRASKGIAPRNQKPGSTTPATVKRPWFADLRTAMEFDLAGIRYRDHIIDSAQGSLKGNEEILGVVRVSLRHKKNDLTVPLH